MQLGVGKYGLSRLFFRRTVLYKLRVHKPEYAAEQVCFTFLHHNPHSPPELSCDRNEQTHTRKLANPMLAFP